MVRCDINDKVAPSGQLGPAKHLAFGRRRGMDMTLAVTLYNVFIASPSDVTWARAQIRQIVHAWNEIHAKHRKAVLLPVGWESSRT